MYSTVNTITDINLICTWNTYLLCHVFSRVFSGWIHVWRSLSMLFLSSVPSDRLKIHIILKSTFMCYFKLKTLVISSVVAVYPLAFDCLHLTFSPVHHTLESHLLLPPGVSSRAGQRLPSWLQQWDQRTWLGHPRSPLSGHGSWTFIHSPWAAVPSCVIWG